MDSSKPRILMQLSAIPTTIETAIFDLGDVLFTWSLPPSDLPVDQKLLQRMLNSATWFQYEIGELSEHQAYASLSKEFLIPVNELRSVFNMARASLHSDSIMWNVVRELKKLGITCYAMSNISNADWEILQNTVNPEDWKVFERVFISAKAHFRKPDVGFYQHVVHETGLNPSSTLFIDDKLENVLSAQAMGMQGIVFTDASDATRKIINMCRDPVVRGKQWLYSQRKNLFSMTSTGVVLKENFTQLLILEATGDKSLVDYVEYVGQFNFFQGEARLTTDTYPNDLDTTAIGLTVASGLDEVMKHKIMDEMLLFQSCDGIFRVYFDQARLRIDPVVCVNVLSLFFQHGRDHEVLATLSWIESVLYHRAYLNGTTYYVTPECFLFFFGRFLQISSLHASRPDLCSVFANRVAERFGAPGDALALAMRILASFSNQQSMQAWKGSPAAQVDARRLRELQTIDGSWKEGWFYKYGHSGLLVGNDGLTTALALRALCAVMSNKSTP